VLFESRTLVAAMPNSKLLKQVNVTAPPVSVGVFGMVMSAPVGMPLDGNTLAVIIHHVLPPL